MPLAQTIGLETLSKYFHLPINDVAKELGVCATVLKKICRKNGIPRWPHRKIKSLDKMILTLEVSVAKNPEDGERIRHEIHTLKNKKMFLMKNPNVLATKAPSMKKGMKKNDKSPIESHESPTGRHEHPHPHHPPYPFVYPYAAYPDHPHYPPHFYPAYNMYHPAAGFKGAPIPYPYYPYPPHYPMEHMDHRRPSMEDECMSPSMVLDPVSAALYLQMPHPHIPYPAMMARSMEPPSERSQWVPNEHSAFTKNSRPKHSPSHQQYMAEHYEQVHMVPQHSPPHHPHPHPPPPPPPPPPPHRSPSHSHHSPSHGHHSPSHGHHSPRSHHSPVAHHPPPSNDYLIHLPELRLPDEKDKPKTLSTLEPSNSTTTTTSTSPSSSSSKNTSPSSPSPSSSSSNTKWPVPQWIEAEQQLLRKEPATIKGYTKREDTSEVPSHGDLTPPPLSIGE